MKATKIIFENLIGTRNNLFNLNLNKNTIESIKLIESNINSVELDFIQEILRKAITCVNLNIKNNKLLSAGRVLNLIHNLPSSKEELKRWDIDYFFSIELPSFLEHYEEVDGVKVLMLTLASNIGNAGIE
jgi:hypothetical protein